MHVTVTLPSNVTVSSKMHNTVVYLDKLRDYPACQPLVDTVSNSLKFILPLGDDFYSCGTSKLHNKLTGTKVYYHKVLIEEKIVPSSSSSPSPSSSSSSRQNTSSEDDAKFSLHRTKQSTSPGSLDRQRSFTNNLRDGTSDNTNDGENNRQSINLSTSMRDDDDDLNSDWTQEAIVVKCIVPSDTSLDRHNRFRRQSSSSLFNQGDLPENFTESTEELIDYSGNVTASAPIPLLNIAVKQNGEFVDTALNVSPGTPLEMIIYLDDVSANVYGLLTSFLRVTDNTPRKQEEIIILNGCSIDPYIFANFETNDSGKSLSAKFRAFKFPESNYVLFVGTVNVCLNSCLGVQCGEGQVGYGRRKRRSVSSSFTHHDPNKVFEAELTAFVKVGYTDSSSSTPFNTNDVHITNGAASVTNNLPRNMDIFASASGAKIESRPASTASKYSSASTYSSSTSSSSSSLSSSACTQVTLTAMLPVFLTLILSCTFYSSSSLSNLVSSSPSC